MKEAFYEADLAAAKGEIPIGAVIVYQNEIIARAHNEVESKHNACAHAEILAIDRASEKLNNWRLNGASIFVTLEPCTMCVGAMVLARIDELYFSCYDARQGATGSLYDLSNFPALPHKIKVYPNILRDKGQLQMSKFFAHLRQDKN